MQDVNVNSGRLQQYSCPLDSRSVVPRMFGSLVAAAYLLRPATAAAFAVSGLAPEGPYTVSGFLRPPLKAYSGARAVIGLECRREMNT